MDSIKPGTLVSFNGTISIVQYYTERCVACYEDGRLVKYVSEGFLKAAIVIDLDSLS